MRPYFLISIVFLVFTGQTKAQECAEILDFKPTNGSAIDWDVFPEFDLPFQLIFGVPIQNANISGPLSHGFTHIADNNYLSSVPKTQRAFLYYGVAYANANQPWEIHRSPWGNNLTFYKDKWNNDYSTIANSLGNPNQIETDIFAFDIERVWRFDHEILQFRNNPIVPNQYAAMNDGDFLRQYKLDMRNLYATAINSFNVAGKSAGNKQTSYADTPIVNTFDNIQGKTWQQWKNNKAGLNFITGDDTGNVGGEFYDSMDFISPSAYYYYDYPHQFAGEYLSYLLFQIEANRAWTTKPIIPFVWLRYSATPEFSSKFIKPWMAEASAIFPFFSGADGLWLWENPSLPLNEEKGIYEYFNKGLYRLSKFKSFFQGSYELVLETSARDYNENKAPIWRGVVKENEILIAAHNPFAKNENEEVTIGVAYKKWSGTVTLKGFETKLCKYDMSVLSTEEDAEFVVFPNPSTNILIARFVSQTAGLVEIRMTDMKGKVLVKMEKETSAAINELSFDISVFNETQFIFQIRIGNQLFTKKISKVE